MNLIILRNTWYATSKKSGDSIRFCNPLKSFLIYATAMKLIRGEP
jgi:hypothetical protein